jgi:MbtH protein
MYAEDVQESQEYKVVINHEEQYSIWPVGKKNPLGWQDVGKQGQKSACLDYIKETWIDMRPLSVRQQLARKNRR